MGPRFPVSPGTGQKFAERENEIFYRIFKVSLNKIRGDFFKLPEEVTKRNFWEP